MPLVAAGIAAGGDLLGGLLGSQSQHDSTQAQLRGLREGRNYDQANYLSQLQMSEPWRFAQQTALSQLMQRMFGIPGQGYQSGVDIARQNLAGASASNNRFGAKAVLKMMKQGMSIEDIAKSGMLKSRDGVVKRLAKHGVSPEQIAMLQAGPMFGGGAQGAPGQMGQMAPLQNPPGYNFFRKEGQRDLLGSFGAGGQGAFSGNALKGITQFNQQYADRNIIQPLMQMAGLPGQAGAPQQQAAQQYGNNMQNNYMQQADVRGSGIANQGNIWGNALSGFGNAFGQGYYDWRHPYSGGSNGSHG